jgi:hypothetical protein
MPGDLLAYRGNGSLEVPGDGSKCGTRGNATRNLFALTKTKHFGGAVTLGRGDAAGGLQHTVNVGGSLA